MMKVSPAEMEIVMLYRAENVAHRKFGDARIAWKRACFDLGIAQKTEQLAKDRLAKAELRNNEARDSLIGMVI
jgi:hypothetical protein